MFIESVQIRNFRSIVNQKFDLANLTTFVGKNDSGKSNVLKALNLFFNGEVAPGIPMVFERDYSQYAPKILKKAKEIQIVLEIKPPVTFSDRRVITWRKAWRNTAELITDPYKEQRFYGGDKEMKSRSKNNFWLDKLTYRYVPAIRGNDYFPFLLHDLHNVLATTIDDKLKNAASNFITIIQKQTEAISSDVSKNLNLSSKINLPDDLSDLFRILDFETSRSISLNQRGDGIKARHIPIILKFLADQQNAPTYATRVDTIWGYEEPENNLEMGKSFDLAEEFLHYSRNIQILLTTHSPVFYMLADKCPDRCSSMRVVSDAGSNDPQPAGSRVNKIEKISQADDDIGLLPLIAPHVERVRKEWDSHIEFLKRSGVQDVFTVVVEGNSDKKIIGHALKLLFPEQEVEIKIGQGAQGVKDILMARLYLKIFQSKMIGVFDGDDAGIKAKKDFGEEKKRHGQNSSKLVKSLILSKGLHLGIPHFQKFNSCGINLPVTIESLFPPEFWRHARDNNWLESNDDEFTRILDVGFSETPEECCRRNGLGDDEMLYVRNVFSCRHKEEFAKYAVNRMSSPANVPESLRLLIEYIIGF